MKIRKQGQFLLKAILLTSSLFVVNNMCAKYKIIRWAKNTFDTDKKTNFLWTTIKNPMEAPIRVELEIPFAWGREPRKTAVHSFLIKPNEEVEIPIMYWGNSSKDPFRNMFILFSIGGQSFNVVETILIRGGQMIYNIGMKSINVSPHYEGTTIPSEGSVSRSTFTRETVTTLIFLMPESRKNKKLLEEIRNKKKEIGLRDKL